MKGEKSSSDPFPEALSFDRASTSNDTNIDQQICFNNTLNCAHNNTLQDYLTSNDDSDTVYSQFPTQQAQNFDQWTMGGPRSIASQNQDTQSVYVQSSNVDVPHDLNTSTENLDQDSDGNFVLTTPPVPYGSYVDPLWDPASGSDNLLDSRRFSSKRKSLERNIGQSSKDGRGQNCSSSLNSSNQSQNVRGISSRDVTNISPFALTLNGNSYSSSGNYHSRISPSHPVDSVPVDLPLTRTSPQLLVQNISSQHLAGGRVASSRRTQNPSRWTEGSISRHGHPSNSRVRIEVSGEVPNIITLPRNILEHHPVFIPANNVRNSIQNSVAPSSGVQFSGPNWVSHRNRPQYPRRLTELVRRSLLASASSDNRGQSSNSIVPLDAIPSGPSSRGYRALNPRSRLLLDGQRDGAIGMPHSRRGLDSASERSRLVIEQIRNVMDLMRRGENLHFEDVVLDPSTFFGMTDSRDHHRDMRLDIDNMSYEELLALEESIGDVSTGLSEETILDLLKKRKYFSIAMSTQMEVEPCCVCQEEYEDGEDVGTLNCGHEFHSACIKQWLMHKNLCPICKTTALSK